QQPCLTPLCLLRFSDTHHHLVRHHHWLEFLYNFVRCFQESEHVLGTSGLNGPHSHTHRLTHTCNYPNHQSKHRHTALHTAASMKHSLQILLKFCQHCLSAPGKHRVATENERLPQTHTHTHKQNVSQL